MLDMLFNKAVIYFFFVMFANIFSITIRLNYQWWYEKRIGCNVSIGKILLNFNY